MFGRSKYKKIIASILEDNEYNPTNLTKLAHYIELTPVKVPKIFNILEKYINANITNESQVTRATKVMSGLCGSCHDHLSLMDSNIVRVIRQCINHSNTQIRQSGMLLFNTYVETADEQSIRKNWNDLQMIPLDLHKISEGKNAVVGLEGLNNCVIMYQTVSEIDQLLTKVTVMRVIFEGLYNNETTEVGKGIIQEIVLSIHDKLTMKRFMEPFLKFLDEQTKWDNDFTRDMLTGIAQTLKPIIRDVMIQTLLEHIPSSQSFKSRKIQLMLVKTLTKEKGNISSDMIRKFHSLLTQNMPSLEKLSDSDVKGFVTEVFEIIKDGISALPDDMIKIDICSSILYEAANIQDNACCILNLRLLLIVFPIINRDSLHHLDSSTILKFFSVFTSENTEIRDLSVRVMRKFLFGDVEVKSQIVSTKRLPFTRIKRKFD
ncbi:Uncharacterized protein QTN25_006737 [Entamoeba marina]